MRLTQGLNRLREVVNQLPPPPPPWKIQRLTERELKAYLDLCRAGKSRDLVEFVRLDALMYDPSRDVLTAFRSTFDRWPRYSAFAPPENDTPEAHTLKNAYLALEDAFESGDTERIAHAVDHAMHLLAEGHDG